MKMYLSIIAIITLLSLAILTGLVDADTAKKCLNSGQRCKTNNDCCSKNCKRSGKKRKRKCQ
ncbi:imperacalcin-like [Leptopilina boulardi]|uniref:imperacalcin-like n=1 Tax=Leptopilina boulardi TaxID=63433 RepID=UPI0021F57D67|nr:imperacalcin-like [Leptopilina boulardi]